MAKDGWYPAKGLVYSVDWIEASRNDSAHYDIVYSYRVADEEYVGQASDYSSPNADCLHKGDTIDILYNPAKPKKSVYPLAKKDRLRVIAAVVGLILGIISLSVLYLTGGFNSAHH